MSVIQVFGLTPLKGEISIQGSKNAVLPMMAAAVLHRGITVLTNVPVIRDVACMLDILEFLGARCCHKGDCLVIDARNITQTSIPERYVTAMRSSIVVLSALLGRMGEGCSCYPGGCLIGARPIDLHLMVLKKPWELRSARRRDTLELPRQRAYGDGDPPALSQRGGNGAGHTGICSGQRCDHYTRAAREPEISQLCRFLNNMGAVICGMGTDHLMIQGVEELHDSSFRVEGDRIVAGTYAAAVAAATGSVILREVCPTELEVPLEMLKQAGVSVRIEKCCKQIRIEMKQRPGCLNIKTGPYPQFPTDLQSPFMAFLASGEGTSTIEERVFEGRFATVRSLIRMGASIRTEERKAVIEGHYPLKGAEVSASDLRGGAALAVAALAAQGETLIRDCHHIERGYEDICRDMAVLGADIRWLERE